MGLDFPTCRMRIRGRHFTARREGWVLPGRGLVRMGDSASYRPRAGAHANGRGGGGLGKEWGALAVAAEGSTHPIRYGGRGWEEDAHFPTPPSDPHPSLAERQEPLLPVEEDGEVAGGPGVGLGGDGLGVHPRVPPAHLPLHRGPEAAPNVRTGVLGPSRDKESG